MLVKPEKAKAVEDQLIQAAQSGRLPGIVTDDKLVQMLDASEPKKATKISVRVLSFFTFSTMLHRNAFFLSLLCGRAANLVLCGKAACTKVVAAQIL
jgi:hypothetical protein